MKYLKNSIKNNKNYLKTVLLFLFLGLIIGFLLAKKITNNELLDQIKNLANYLSTNRINFLLNHTTTMCISFIVSLTIIGLVLFPLNIIYEGICISFNIFTLTSVFKLNGFMYGLIFSLFTKCIYLILLIIIYRKILTIIKTIFNKKDKLEKKTIIIKKVKQINIFSCLMLLNDILIFLIGNKILALFLFLIK